MREIKFRAWDMSDHGNNKMRILDVSSGFSSVWLKEDAVTKVMQFTGLLDKNGVEIYEGDIVDIMEDENVMVVYNSKDGRFEYRDRGGDLFDELAGYDDCYSVIGNIHETPELLK